MLYERGAVLGLGKELPRLRSLSSPPSSVSLFWQLAYSSYGLESCSNLTTAPWLPVSHARTQADTEWLVVSPKQPTREFFRLKKP